MAIKWPGKWEQDENEAENTGTTAVLLINREHQNRKKEILLGNKGTQGKFCWEKENTKPLGRSFIQQVKSPIWHREWGKRPRMRERSERIACEEKVKRGASSAFKFFLAIYSLRSGLFVHLSPLCRGIGIRALIKTKTHSTHTFQERQLFLTASSRPFFHRSPTREPKRINYANHR